MDTIRLEGSCLCGALRYCATGMPRRFFHCHCGRCRKVTGTGHASNLFIKGELEWTSDTDTLTSYQLPEAERFGNHFCSTCGSRVPRAIEKVGVVMIPAGSLDSESPIQPEAHIFAGSKADWSCDQRDIPVFERYAE